MYLAILTLRIVLFLSLFHIGLLFKFPHNLHIRRWERTFLSVYFFFAAWMCMVASLHGCLVASNIMNPKTTKKVTRQTVGDEKR